MHTASLLTWPVLFTFLGLSACSNTDTPNEPDTGALADTASEDAEDDTAADTDVTSDTEDEDTGLTDTGDDDTSTDEDTAGDVEADTTPWPDPLTFNHRWPIFDAPVDPLAATDLESCATYQAETCGGIGEPAAL